MAFTFFGVTASRTPRDSMRPASARSAVSSSLSSNSRASPSALVAGAASPSISSDEKDAKDARLAVDIGQLMRKDSNYSPKDIADFLHQLPHLDPKMVGRVLGEPDELALSVLQEYANGFVFKDFSFDVALRVYLGRFVLPGEAQKIDRILQAFAKAYYAANPRDKVCSSEDAVYTLAFSAVLLNTDAHNPHLAKKHKMGKDDFIRNHQRILVDGRAMPHDYLARCYDSFASYPIQLLPRKPAALLRDELELTFADGPLGLDIETSIDGRTCVVKRYAAPHRHIYCTLGTTTTATNASSSSSTDDEDDQADGKAAVGESHAPSEARALPDLAGFVVVAVADDCTRALGYALTRYLLKTAARPVTIRFCEPSVYFESIASL